MKFSTDRESLLEPLNNVIGAVERRQTNPVLANLLLRADGDIIKVTATDSEIEIHAHMGAHVDQDGSCTVPARKLYDICRNLPDSARIDLDVGADKAILKSGRSKFVLATLPAEQFPLVEPLNDLVPVTVLAQELRQCIASTAFSMAHQDVRFYLNGLLLELTQGKITAVSTDGHRLAFAQANTDASPDEAIRVIIPRKSVQELLRLLGQVDQDSEVMLRLSQEMLQLDLDGLRMSTKLIDGRFPDYNRVIPIDGDKELVVDVATMKQSLMRASVLTNDKFRGVRLTIEPGLIVLSTNSPEQEEARDEIEVEYDGGAADIGFNITYLQDVLNAIDGENVRMRIKDGNSSALLMPEQDSDRKYVIMPMRL